MHHQHSDRHLITLAGVHHTFHMFVHMGPCIQSTFTVCKMHLCDWNKFLLCVSLLHGHKVPNVTNMSSPYNLPRTAHPYCPENHSHTQLYGIFEIQFTEEAPPKSLVIKDD